MKKKKKKKVIRMLKPLIKNEADFRYIESLEQTSYCLLMSGDVLMVNDRLFFSKETADRHYSSVLKDLLSQYEGAKSKQALADASDAILSLKVSQLRVH